MQCYAIIDLQNVEWTRIYFPLFSFLRMILYQLIGDIQILCLMKLLSLWGK